jgi:hypothetical protein
MVLLIIMLMRSPKIIQVRVFSLRSTKWWMQERAWRGMREKNVQNMTEEVVNRQPCNYAAMSICSTWVFATTPAFGDD